MADDPLRFPDISRSELDATIRDLIARAERVLAVQGRLRGLLAAMRVVSEDLDLDHVLTRIVRAATELVNAEYGALGVIDDQGRLERFIHVGMDEERVAAIGHLPHGDGLLGAVIESGDIIRLAHLGDDPRSVGFPENHPPMDSFLGVPIRVRDTVFGNLYLTDRRDGGFTQEDEELIASLATTAGIAIDNARLFDRTRRQERLSRALSDISATLLSEEATDALALVADRVALAVPADLITVVVPSGPDEVRVDVARGPGSDEIVGALFPAAGTLADQAMTTGEVVTDSSTERELLDGRIRLGPTAAVPLATSPERRIGALCVSRTAGRAPFTADELGTVAEFARQAGVALSLAWARQDRQRLQVIEERGRIARDLHDHVIQRLFAVGLGIQVIADAAPAHRAQLDAYVSDLDAAIADIRMAVFALRGSGHGGGGLRHRLLDVVTEMSPALTTPPRVAFSGPVDLMTSGPLADDVVAVVRECLANVAKHAQAESTTLAVGVDGARITVTVEDDGAGVPEGAVLAGGTANLAHRARDHGGDFVLERLSGRGTRARWTAPLAAG